MSITVREIIETFPKRAKVRDVMPGATGRLIPLDRAAEVIGTIDKLYQPVVRFSALPHPLECGYCGPAKSTLSNTCMQCAGDLRDAWAVVP